MINSHSVECVVERQYALNLIGTNGDFKHFTHPEIGLVSPGETVGRGKYRTEIIRGVSPLVRQPRVVKIQPSDRGGDIKCRL